MFDYFDIYWKILGKSFDLKRLGFYKYLGLILNKNFEVYQNVNCIRKERSYIYLDRF